MPCMWWNRGWLVGNTMMHMHKQTDRRAVLISTIRTIYPKAGTSYRETLLAIASSHDPGFLARSAFNSEHHLGIVLNPISPAPAVSKALGNPNPKVRTLAAAHSNAPQDALRTLLDKECDKEVLLAAIGNINTPYTAIDHYLKSPDSDLRKAVAARIVDDMGFAVRPK